MTITNPLGLLRSAALLLTLPGLGLTWLAARHGHAHPLALAAIGFGLLPLAALPGLQRAWSGPPGQARLLRGLGANAAARWRLLWLPVFAPPVALGVSAAAVWLLLAATAPPLGANLAGGIATLLHPRPSAPL